MQRGSSEGENKVTTYKCCRGMVSGTDDHRTSSSCHRSDRRFD